MGLARITTGAFVVSENWMDAPPAELNGGPPRRSLYPLDVGPRVRLSDGQHVAIWISTLIGVAIAVATIWRLAS